MNKHKSWFPEVLGYCNSLELEFDLITEARKIELQKIRDHIVGKMKSGQETSLTVICTHNSRRSHCGQIWLQVASDFYGIENIKTFSGGTEATAFHQNAVDALKRTGFQEAHEPGDNPSYKLSYASGKTIECFSKRFDHAVNPSDNFAAIMVCNDAAEACPFVPGAEKRFVLPYDDPKEFDDTDMMKAKYDERWRQIAREMFYIVKDVVGS
ncbi:MAG: protein-tyrosine-phosphatase [Bacteroidetes bacterium]|nr:protein-tyrosine-phosphatase [Bacteroidota bacterium]MDA1119893.1 protein-tyrosine-phosphatase [Bacteroidota bacterium]